MQEHADSGHGQEGKVANGAVGPIYSCVFCLQDFTGKKADWSCKRHLINIEVAPVEYFVCHCGERCANGNQLRRHRRFQCREKDTGIRATEKRRSLQVYACGLTGDSFGSNLNAYVDHLTRLCATDRSQRHQLSQYSIMHRKMMAILKTSGLHRPLRDASLQWLGSPDAWSYAEWFDLHEMGGAIVKIESGVICLHPAANDQDGWDKARDFVDDLVQRAHLAMQPALTYQRGEVVHNPSSDTTSAYTVWEQPLLGGIGERGGEMLEHMSTTAASGPSLSLDHVMLDQHLLGYPSTAWSSYGPYSQEASTDSALSFEQPWPTVDTSRFEP